MKHVFGPVEWGTSWMGDHLNGGPVEWGTSWLRRGHLLNGSWQMQSCNLSFNYSFFLSTWWKRTRPGDLGWFFSPFLSFLMEEAPPPWWCPYMDPGQSLLSTILPQESVWVEQPVNRATQWNGSNLMIIFINSDHLLVKSDFSFNIIKFPNVTAEQWTSPSSYLVKQKSKKSVKECSF